MSAVPRLRSDHAGSADGAHGAAAKEGVPAMWGHRVQTGPRASRDRGPCPMTEEGVLYVLCPIFWKILLSKGLCANLHDRF